MGMIFRKPGDMIFPTALFPLLKKTRPAEYHLQILSGYDGAFLIKSFLPSKRLAGRIPGFYSGKWNTSNVSQYCLAFPFCPTNCIEKRAPLRDEMRGYFYTDLFYFLFLHK